MDIPVTVEDARRVATLVAPHVRRTPLSKSAWLSERLGREVLLKCENLQATGSFKLRGAFAALLSADREPVVAASAGNHGQALALAARTLGVDCTIVVPRGCPAVKVEGIRRLRARVVTPPPEFPQANVYDGAEAYMREQAPGWGGRVVSPFEDPMVVAGNGGSLGLELLDQCPTVGTVVVPCGGGGCVGGIGVVARARAGGPRVIGVNTDASPGMWRSFRDGRAHLSVPDASPTIADGLEGGVRASSYDLCRRVVDDIALVAETTLARAVRALLLGDKILTEGSGAAGVGALLDGTVVLDRGSGPVCVVLTGGNIDRPRLRGLLAEADPQA